jgi:hypothetical protein
MVVSSKSWIMEQSKQSAWFHENHAFSLAWIVNGSRRKEWCTDTGRVRGRPTRSKLKRWSPCATCRHH